MLYHRGFYHDVEALHFKIVTLCALFALSTFGPCTITGTHNPIAYDLNSGENSNQFPPQTSLPKLTLENICKRSDLFCFPSTLSGFFTDFHTQEANLSGLSRVKPVLEKSTPSVNNLTWSTNHGNFQLPNGNIVSCSLEYQENPQIDENDTKDESFIIKSTHVNDFSSPHIQISHHILDWGQKYLHSPSITFLTLQNLQNHSFLNIFEPYSTNLQFYPCNNTEFNLSPGEIASICFIFFPKSLGLSSGHLILQTNLGGFLIQTRGFAIESPYTIHPSVSGKFNNFVSIFNPSEKVLHLKEVSFRVSFSSGNISYSIKGVCSVKNHNDSDKFSFEEWLEVKIGQHGQTGRPIIAIRPQKWTVGSNRDESILELEFPYNSQAKTVFGSFCVQLQDLDTIVVEEEFGGQSRLLVSLNVLVPCDANGTITVSLMVENDGPEVVKIFKIREIGDNFESLKTKFVEGLILFPYSVTQVGILTYVVNQDANLHCKLLVETNKSDAPDLEISCSDIVGLCSWEKSDGVLNYDNVDRVLPLLGIKVTETTKSDESVLGNWKSQGTNNKMSILNNNNNELTFPIVHVNTHQSKYINVINPSNQPVIMQLLLNSGEIITNCQKSDQILHPSSFLNSQITPSRYGFSIPQHAVTEAYVPPHKKAILGPVFFHPSSRCEWKSSALVRNNLSGVEWVSLRGSGGSPGLVLLNGSDPDPVPVHTVKLEHRGFGQRSVKILFVKNTGDLPVEVEKVSVSGTKCELDGFFVRDCNGFGLLPGESRNVMVSFRADFCAGIVRRELEFVMSGGILVVPVEVGISSPMLTICKRSHVLMKLKKFVLAVLVFGFLILMACSCTVSFVIRDGDLSKMPSGKEDCSSDVCPKPETVKMKVQPPETAKEVAVVEAAKPENLTVKTGKDKSRRRKKKRVSGSNPGLISQFEVSSSHSSNSTPSSPLSPPSSLTPKRSAELSLSQHVRAKSPVKRSTVPLVKEEPSLSSLSVAPVRSPGPQARAPGAERKVVNLESSAYDPRYKYNIWDDHLRVLPTIPEDNNFGSLFAMSPQELFTNVSRKQNDQ
ncbi:uncharacterized protein LOC111891458 isoform X1 [Lactuca sativa]|uniref:uncharacterized protein LOC111891458 isoform X1 n=1 Tax=Lactuca sativa TaxID=4236 RepID=UPI000CA800DD|nr:uncharacterized protein LOC111891458 isoform X1 [Lactuca sativa]